MKSKIKILRILLVDDEAVIRKTMRELLITYEAVQVKGEVRSKQETIAFLQKNKVDVIFTDIQMEGGSGFELAEEVHMMYPTILVVFLTGHVNFALDGYMYGPVDFLIKPVSRQRLEQTIKRIRERLFQLPETKKNKNIGIQTEEGFQIFSIQQIAYLEKEDRKVKIVSKNGSFVKSGESIQEFEEVFFEYDFFRCHQSYIVPLFDIQEIRQETFGRAYKIRLRNADIELPLSRRKYYEMKEILQMRGIPFY